MAVSFEYDYFGFKTITDISDKMKNCNPEALQWLLDIPMAKWSVLHTQFFRFGTYTSNNVESINSVLKNIRNCLYWIV